VDGEPPAALIDEVVEAEHRLPGQVREQLVPVIWHFIVTCPIPVALSDHQGAGKRSD
jgi:hypothetical protein